MTGSMGHGSFPLNLQRQEAPQGSTKPDSRTGSPSSCASERPPLSAGEYALTEVNEHRGGQAGGVCVQEYKERMIRQYVGDEP